MFRRLLLIGIFTFTGCQNPSPRETKTFIGENGLPPISMALECLQNSGPIIAAHRGRDKLKRHPENALSSLKSLRSAGFVIAEIDVARLKDGAHILHHDGVWDDTTTGKGIVAATRWEDAQKFLLKTRKGSPMSERLATLERVLNWADKDFYLELDFKSSANAGDIIKAIKDAGMTQHVILIAYSDKQADYLRGLSRRITGQTMLISGPKGKTRLQWLGTKTYKPPISKTGYFTAYGMMSPKYAKRADYSALSILVSDFPSEAKTVSGIKTTDRKRIASCKF